MNYYDGLTDKIYNKDGKSLYTHCLMNNRSTSWQTNGTSWNGFMRNITSNYINSNSQVVFISSQDKFMRDWISFIGLQNYGFSFKCTLGCDRGGNESGEMSCLVYDGVAVDFPVKYAINALPPTKLVDEEFVVKTAPNFNISDRFIKNKKLRDKGKMWYNTFIGNFNQKIKNPSKLNQRKKNQFYKDLTTEESESISKLLKYIETDINIKNNIYVKRFLRSIFSDEPIYLLFNENITAELKNAFEQETMNQKKKIFWKSPIIAHIIFDESIRSNNNFCHLFNDVLKFGSEKSKNIIDVYINNRKKYNKEKLLDDEMKRKYELYINSGSYYAAPAKRFRPIYENDIKGKKEPGCSKNWEKFTKHKTGGIWISRCAYHGICGGFHTIVQNEGHTDLFSALMVHYSRPPDVLVGDFNCKCVGYVKRREPEFFKDTIMAVDAFHWSNSHTGCSYGANIKNWTNSIKQLKYINSSAAEQRNLIIEKLTASAKSMQMHNFIFHVLFILEMDNRVITRHFNNEKTYMKHSRLLK